MKILCDIYKSSKQEEMYLYVKKQEGLNRVPQLLLDRFGKPVHVVTMIVGPEKQFARVTTSKLLEELDRSGFYLQLPPQKETYMQEINRHNSKLQ